MSRSTNKRDLDDDDRRFEKALPIYQHMRSKEKRANELAIAQERKRQLEEDEEHD